MKYEDIKKAKVGDKVVVIGTVKNIDALDGSYHYRVELPNECGGTTKSLRSNDILAKLSDFTDRKVKFTEAEKKEFDKLLKRHPAADLNDFLNAIYDYSKTYSALHKQLFGNAKGIIDRKKQFEFVHALENPDLIEVIKSKKYYVHLFPWERGYLNKSKDNGEYTIGDKRDISDWGAAFTKEEIAQIPQDTFKITDKALEEVEEDERN
jgi:hypothetical protein